MSYKGMLLSALLVPVVATSYCKDSVDSRIQQLKEARFQKELELSELGAKIAEKQNLLEEMYEDANAHISVILSNLKLEEQASDQYISEINASSERFEELFSNKESIKGLLLKELIIEEEPFPGDFEVFKFWKLRGKFEHNLLETYIEKYEVCLQELIEINRELDKPQEGVL
jgi:hypothetical protein